jgi:hypothetical protein
VFSQDSRLSAADIASVWQRRYGERPPFQEQPPPAAGRRGSNGKSNSNSILMTSSPEFMYLNETLGRLKSLDLSGNKLSVASVELLCDYFAQCCRLSDVALARCGINETGVSLLLASFRFGGCDSLLKLDLKDNSIALTSKVFCEQLSFHKSLQFLDVGGNLVDSEVEKNKKYLSKAVLSLTELKALCVSCMRLKGAATIIMSHLADHKSIRVLDLANAFLDSDSVPGIQKLLGQTTSLQFLMLHGIVGIDSIMRTPALPVVNKAAASGSGRDDNNSSPRRSIELLAAKKDIQVIFEGHYEGIDLRMPVVQLVFK